MDAPIPGTLLERCDRRTFIAAILACSFGLSVGCTGSTDPSPSVNGVVVIEVVDGDTVDIAVNGVEERVRLLGIDAPESVHPTVPQQCFGAEASNELKKLLPPGTEIDVGRDEQLRDHYGRLLLYVFRAGDDLAVNRHMVANGLAATAFYEPNTYLRSDLLVAERKAKRGGIGLWGVCDGPDQPLQ